MLSKLGKNRSRDPESNATRCLPSSETWTKKLRANVSSDGSTIDYYLPAVKLSIICFLFASVIW